MAAGASKEEDGKEKKAPEAVVLGYAILAGSMLSRVPQVYKIHAARSARGISLSTTLIGMAIQISCLAYSVFEGHRFTTYGENVPHFVSSVAVALQTLHYDRGASRSKLLAVAAACLSSVIVACRAKLIFGAKAGGSLVHSMQAAVPAMLVVEKLPQIVQTFRARSAGEQSLSTSAFASIGNAVRLFTSLRQLSHDWKAVAPHLSALCANVIVTLQITAYGGL